MLLDLPAATLIAAREGGRVENNGVEFLAAVDEAGEDIEDVVGDEPMVRGGIDLVERKIFASSF